MRQLTYLAIAFLTLAACTQGSLYQPDNSFSAYDQHCREHARDMVGEADNEARYQECMKLHGFYYVPETDAHLTGAH